MNENVNLSKILRDCLKGTKLYSPLFGVVKFEEISEDWNFVCVRKGKDIWTFTYDARFLFGISNSKSAEIMLFPSKYQRDWSKFEYKNPKPKFDHKTLKLMDKVLVRNSDDNKWRCALYSYTIDGNEVNKYVTIDCSYNYHRYCIPYNEDTQHLTGTTDEAPEFYKY